MIDWLQTVTLALIQGLTEFLPVSSSAHLILVPDLLGWPDQGLHFDIAVHFGTLIAVIVYFRDDLRKMGLDTFICLKSGQQTAYSKMSFQILLATIPVGLAGLLSYHFISTYMRSPLIIAGSTIFFGILLLLSDRVTKKQGISLSYKQAMIIGLAQILALIPGTSRSGITLTAGLSLGLDRQLAARFSFLLSIPVILLAMLLECKKLFSVPGPQPWLTYGVAIFVSSCFAFLCIHYFLKWLNQVGVVPFVIYRCLLGVFLLFFFL